MSLALRIVFNTVCRHRIGKQYAWRGLQTRTSRLPSLLNARRDWKQSSQSEGSWPFTSAAVTTGLVLGWYLFDKKDSSLVSLPLLEAAEDEEKVKKVSLRERRYKDFASVVYRGAPYMTGRDFLEAITKKTPRCEYQVDYHC